MNDGEPLSFQIASSDFLLVFDIEQHNSLPNNINIHNYSNINSKSLYFS